MIFSTAWGKSFGGAWGASFGNLLSGIAISVDASELLAANDRHFNVMTALANTQEFVDSTDSITDLLTAIGLALDSLKALDQSDNHNYAEASQSELVSLLDQIGNYAIQVVELQETSSLSDSSKKTTTTSAGINEASTGIDISSVINFAVSAILETSQVQDLYDASSSGYRVQVAESTLVNELSSSNAIYIVASSINSQAQSNGLLIKAYINSLSAIRLGAVTAQIVDYPVIADVEILDDGKPVALVEPQYIKRS